MDVITGQGGERKQKKGEKSCNFSHDSFIFIDIFYFANSAVFHPYTQINLLFGKGKTDRKSRTATYSTMGISPIAKLNGRRN